MQAENQMAEEKVGIAKYVSIDIESMLANSEIDSKIMLRTVSKS